MPGFTEPVNKPKGTKVTFANGSFSWLNCGQTPVSGQKIWDWDATADDYVKTSPGTTTSYNKQGGGTITVTDGVID